MTIPSAVSQLRHARQKVIRKAVEASERGDVAEKLAWEMRRQHIDRTIDRLLKRERRELGERSVFVSYAVRTGSVYFSVLARRLEQEGFVVHTGFDRVDGTGEGTVLGRILRQLRRSSLYCGILSKELRVVDHSEPRWAPSVWSLEEKGMAVALGKPFHLLVEEDIHPDYWLKAAPEKVHTLFNDGNFLEKVEIAVEELKDRYTELAMRLLHPPAA